MEDNTAKQTIKAGFGCESPLLENSVSGHPSPYHQLQSRAIEEVGWTSRR
jgi:hypothetical protein